MRCGGKMSNNKKFFTWKTYGEKIKEREGLDASELVKHMSNEELLSFVPRVVLEHIAAGFLAGILGPKKHRKNNWMSLGLQSTSDILPSFLGHIAQAEKNLEDPDTGLDPLIFVAARSAMYVYIKSKEKDKKPDENN